MKTFTRLLLAVGVMVASASAYATSATLLVDGLHSASGSSYIKVWNGSDGNPASTMVWDWNSGTGVMTGTGTFYSTYYLGPCCGSSFNTDVVTNISINTTAGTTTAASYLCQEGTFLPSVGASGCLNLNLGGNFALDSTAVYNVGGDANCINLTVGGDDVSGGPVSGLGTSSGGTCAPQTPAYGDWIVTNFPTGILVLSNSANPACYNATKNPACGNTTYMKFQVIPVPAAAWLFGSSIGLFAWIRRRAKLSA